MNNVRFIICFFATLSLLGCTEEQTTNAGKSDVLIVTPDAVELIVTPDAVELNEKEQKSISIQGAGGAHLTVTADNPCCIKLIDVPETLSENND